MRSELDTIDHVLRGALNTILLNLQLLSTSLEGDDRASPLIERASAEVKRVATGLLPSALRIVSLEVTEHRRVDLRQLVERVRREQDVVPSPPAPRAAAVGDASVDGDPELLALALAHLFRNAVAATPADGPAPQIAVEPGPEDTIAVVVCNACAGPPPALGADGTPVVRGRLGGIAAVVRIARLHAGTLTYERSGHELRARLSLPAATASGAMAPPAGRPARAT